MNRHPLISAFSAIFFLCFFTTINAQYNPASKEFEKNVDSIFMDKADLKSPGASVIVVKDGEIILTKNYGSANLPFGVPFNENTRFPLNNLTDQLVAFSILQLDKKGLIKLTDPVNKYLPEFGFENNILITHLLNHSSDLPFLLSLRLMAGWKFSDPFYKSDFLNLTKKFTKDLKPDTKIGHSHSGINILLMLVEKVSGGSFSKYATANIFQPLGMTSTVIKDAHYRENKYNSIGYDETDDGFQRTYPTALVMICPMTYSTQKDFKKWMLNFQTKKFERKIIEKMDQALSMKGVSQERTNGAYCLGQQQYYRTRGQDEFYFIDSDEGHSWRWRRFPQSKLSIMVVGNLNYSFRTEVNAIINLLLPPSIESSNSEEAEAIPVKLSQKEMEACTGFYWNEDWFYTTEISIVDGELYHSDNYNGFNFAMSPKTKTLYYTPFGGTIEFSNTGGNKKKFTNILPNGRVFKSYQYDESALKEGDQLKYIGIYSSDKLNAFYSIVWEDQKLILRRSRKPDLVLNSLGGNRFHAAEIDFRVVEFEENQIGVIQKMKISTPLLRGVEFMKRL